MPPLPPASITTLPTFSFHHHAHPLSSSFRESQKSPQCSCSSCPLAQPLPHAQLTLLLLEFKAFFQHDLPDAGLHVSITTSPSPSVATTDHFITVLQVNSLLLQFYSWDILTPKLSCVLIHTMYKPGNVCSLQNFFDRNLCYCFKPCLLRVQKCLSNKCRFVLHMITLLWRTLFSCCQPFLCISPQRLNKSCCSSFSRSFVVHPSSTCLVWSLSHRTNSQSCHHPSAHDTTTLGHSHISPYRLCDALQCLQGVVCTHLQNQHTCKILPFLTAHKNTWQGSGSCAGQTSSCWFVALLIWPHTSSHTVSGARLFYRWSCEKPGLGLDDPCGSQFFLRFHATCMLAWWGPHPQSMLQTSILKIATATTEMWLAFAWQHEEWES